MRVFSTTMSNDAVVGGGFDAGREKKEEGLRACHYKHYMGDEEAGMDRIKATRVCPSRWRVYCLHVVVRRD